MVVSSWSSTSLEEIAAAVPNGIRWFQMYVTVDRQITRNIVRRVERAGYKALVLTIDTPFAGRKYADERCNFTYPPHIRYSTCLMNIVFWSSEGRIIKMIALIIYTQTSDEHLLYLALCWRSHFYISAGHLILAIGPFQRHVCDQKKWKISLLNGYSSWYKHAINRFLIDNSASCSSQDIQVFEN